MKKLLLMIACIVFCLPKTQAQNEAGLTTEKIQIANDYEIHDRNDTTLTITQIWNIPGHQVRVCANKYNHVLVYPPTGCTDFLWEINGEFVYDNYVTFDKDLSYYHAAYFYGCGYNGAFEIFFIEPNVPNETTTELWKRQYETITLEVPSGSYTYLWNTGATTATIEVIEPGTYTCGVSDMCATSVQNFIVQDNVEITLATCDLESNLNMVTWQSNPAQAEYIDHVIVKRDGIQVGTANYADGYFMDAIGSGAASRTYTLVAVATDGTECPIMSYPKETIHMSYTLGMGNNIEMGWNIPTGYDLLGFNICEWHPNGKDGDLTVIDFVGASVTSYTCSENQFNNGYVVVQGVENGKTESRLLSNRSEEGIVGLGEQQSKTFQIHPNPSNGAFIVEGPQALTVFNMMGQVVATSHAENGIHTISLGSAGVYFVRNDEGVVRKVVVK